MDGLGASLTSSKNMFDAAFKFLDCFYVCVMLLSIFAELS